MVIIVAVTNGGSGFISCVDFIVTAPTTTGDAGASSAIAPIAILAALCAFLALF